MNTNFNHYRRGLILPVPVAGLLLFFSSCSVIQKTSLEEFPEGKYKLPSGTDKSFLQTDTLVNVQDIKTIYLFNENDSLFFKTFESSGYPSIKGVIYPLLNDQKKVVLVMPSFDFDVFTTPFKFRPAADDIPQQFNANFNGSFYFGYRLDRYKLEKKQIFPGVQREQFSKQGIGFGGFLGVGTAFINPKFMRNTIDYEYDGLVVNYGIAVIMGVRKFNTGISIGFDFLTDKNKNNWVYQHKPWIGIFIGFNLN